MTDITSRVTTGQVQAYRARVAVLSARLRDGGMGPDDVARNLPGELVGEVVTRKDHQPEFEWTPGAYVTRLVTQQRIDEGRRALAEHIEGIEQIAERYGVPQQFLVAIWAIESNFGRSAGTWPVLGVLLTLSIIDERRTAFWTAELEAAVTIVLARGKRRQQPLGAPSVEGAAGVCRVLEGSWAGAMGQVQFMPTSLLAYGVDADGDGIVDITGSLVDALASAANYLAKHGWSAHLPWGYQVAIGDHFDWHSADQASRPVRAWQAAGVRMSVAASPQSAGPWHGDLLARLVVPEGADGPVFLVTENFDAVLAYNRAVPYALAVCLLADAIVQTGFTMPTWRSADHGLSRAEKQRLQSRLVAMGWETGGVDGILGVQSREAIRAYQLRNDLMADGYADRDLLLRLDADTTEVSG